VRKLRDVEALPQAEAEEVLTGEVDGVYDADEPDLLSQIDGNPPSRP